MLYGIYHPKLLRNLYQHNPHVKIRHLGKFLPKIPKNENFMSKSVIFQISKSPFWCSLKKTPT